jgi:hypothetical protein
MEHDDQPPNLGSEDSVFLGSVLPPYLTLSVCPDVRFFFSPVRLYSLNLPPDARVAPGSCTVQYKQLILSGSVSVQRLE